MIQPSWCPSAVRYILRNRKYLGDFTWNRHRWLLNAKTGKRRRVVRCEEEWVKISFEELRIVEDDPWQRVDRRFNENKHKGKLKRGGIRNHYLLSGLMGCSSCGSNYVIVGGGAKEDPLYGCSLNWNRGKSVCPNHARVRRSELETTVLDDIKTQLLNPVVLGQIVDAANDALSQKITTRPTELADLGSQRREKKAAIDNILEAIESGAAFSQELRNRLEMREGELRALDSRISSLSRSARATKLTVDVAYVEDWISKLEGLLQADMLAARAELTGLLVRIELEPVVKNERRWLKATSQTNLLGLLAIAKGNSKEYGSGGGIRTPDLRVMSPTSYRTAPPRARFASSLSSCKVATCQAVSGAGPAVGRRTVIVPPGAPGA